MICYLCEDNFDNILCGIYDAWASPVPNAQVRLELKDNYNMELFCEYTEVETDQKKAQKVAQTVRKRISEEAFQCLYRVSLHSSSKKADIMFRFLICGFRIGPETMSCLQVKPVMSAFELSRFVSNEAHLLLGFIRFHQVQNDILFAAICPENHVIPLVAPHFADRLSGENWMIYDEKRNLVAVHRAGMGWVMAQPDADFRTEIEERENTYEDLWKVFFRSVSIDSRRNEKLQKTMLPLRYRKNMTEFTSDTLL